MNIEQTGKEYIHEGHAVYSCQYHIVFCPKYRRKLLTGDIAARLKELFVEAQSVYGYVLIDCEIMPDHVHMLAGIKPTVKVTDMIGRIKGYTSHILRQEFPEINRRLPTLWTRGKFVSTCGTVSLEVVKKYIADQKGK
jgi:putative transposase